MGDTLAGDPATGVVTQVDVAIVGAGPAGLAAAVTCARAGLKVCLVDRGTGIGGQYWRQSAEPRGGSEALAPHTDGRPRAASGRRHPQHDLSTFAALRDRLGESVCAGLVDLRLRTQVWTAVGSAASDETGSAEPRTDLHLLGPGRGRVGTQGGVAGVVRARRVVLATGAHDIALPFPGWDLPGVMTIGGIQALLNGSDVVPGRRVALGGTGPFLLPVAAGLADRGVEVVGVFEANAPTTWLPHLSTVARHPARLGEGLTYAARLVRRRVPFRPRTIIVEAHGCDRVEAVSVCRLDGAGTQRPETLVRHTADAVGIGWGFSPILDLALTLGCATRRGDNGFAVVAVDTEQRSSVPGVLVAGEPTGIGGAALSLAEGELAGHIVVADLVGSGDTARPGAIANSVDTADPLAEIARSRERRSRRRTVQRDVVLLQAFASAMHTAHPVPAGWAASIRPDTVVCRCEEVDAATVFGAIETGADSARQVKQLTRAGMGWCQGRICEPACALLVAGAAPQADQDQVPATGPAQRLPLAGETERLVAQPVSLGALADLLTPSSRPPIGLQ